MHDMSSSLSFFVSCTHKI